MSPSIVQLANLAFCATLLGVPFMALAQSERADELGGSETNWILRAATRFINQNPFS